MKRILLLLMLLPGIGVAQEDDYTKEELELATMYAIVGKWTHIQSVYPSGNTDTYFREFLFWQDSIFRCTRIQESDTITQWGFWYVRDTCIYLHTQINDTLVMLGDVVFIDHLEHDKMFLRKLWGEEFARKTSYYERTR